MRFYTILNIKLALKLGNSGLAGVTFQALDHILGGNAADAVMLCLGAIAQLKHISQKSDTSSALCSKNFKGSSHRVGICIVAVVDNHKTVGFNEVISSNLPVTIEFVSREAAASIVDLSKLPEDASETLRIVRIGDYDACACIGAHVKNTSEIGTFKIISHSYENGVWRLRWKVIKD